MTDTFTIWKEAAHLLPKGLAVVDPEGTIQFVNRTWAREAAMHGLSPLWDRPGINLIRHFKDSIYDHKPFIRKLWRDLKCILDGSSTYYSAELHSHDLVTRWYLMEAVPINAEEIMPVGGMLLVSSDITVYKELEVRLQAALAQVRTLHGLLPICAVCKKIKDEEEQWSPIEEYLIKHTHAEFTHDICPDCIRLLYPKYSSILDRLDKPSGD
ncbi:PAS domain-containing protein [Fontibacillus sp. BL9]|uniref:PAS domain-containing protein n=1 Tax=Fontibacillus sp. BL9 TaxID=3389971 RepID=UPI0039786E1A